MSTFLRDILSKGRIWESVSQREVGDHSQITILYLRLNGRSSFNFGLYPQVEKQVRREEALERLLARRQVSRQEAKLALLLVLPSQESTM